MKTVRQAIQDYHDSIQKADEQIRFDFIEILKELGMHEVDVVRKHDGRVGRILVRKSLVEDMFDFEFHAYQRGNKLGVYQTGRIPNDDAENYLKNNFSVMR